MGSARAILSSLDPIEYIIMPREYNNTYQLRFISGNYKKDQTNFD